MTPLVTALVLLATAACVGPAGRRPSVRDPVPAGGASRGAGRPTPRDPQAELDVPLLLVLLEAALAAGVPPGRALSAVGSAVGGTRGGQLVRAGARLSLGAPWRDACAGADPAVQRVGVVLAGALGEGASPVPSLRAERARLLRQRRARADRASAQLGVWLVLPLGLAYLPAFMLLGLVPVVLSLGRSLL